MRPIAVMSVVAGLALVGCTSSSNRTNESISQAVPFIPDEFECYLAPSPFFEPGTIVRVRLDEDGEIIDGATAVVARRSPIENYNNADFADALQGAIASEISGSTALSAMAQFLTDPASLELSAGATYTTTVTMKSVNRLLLDDADFRAVRQYFADGDIVFDGFKYFWIKEAYFSPEVTYSFVDNANANFEAQVALEPADVRASVEANIKSDDSASLVSKSGIMPCIFYEPLDVRVAFDADGRSNIVDVRPSADRSVTNLFINGVQAPE